LHQPERTIRAAAFQKAAPEQGDKLGVIMASISLIDAAVNCRHGARIACRSFAFLKSGHFPPVDGPDG
jgi:hypothetical protein